MRRDDDFTTRTGATARDEWHVPGAHRLIHPLGGDGATTSTLAAGAEQPQGLDDQLCFALYAATNAVVRAYRPLLLAVGLTYPQYVVLMALWETDDVSTTALGARVQMSPGDLDPVLDGLVGAELVERRHHRLRPGAVRVALSDRGRLMEERATVAQHEVRCQTRLSTGELQQLRGSLHDLTANLDADVDGSRGRTAVDGVPF